VVLLIALSRFKFEILQLSLTFLDFLIIDRDTFSFLLSVFPRLRTQLIVAGVLAVPALWVIWRSDPFRAGRRLALAILAATTVFDVSNVGRGARATVGAVPGRQSYFAVSRARLWWRCHGWLRQDGSRPIHLRAARFAWPREHTPPAGRRCRPTRNATARQGGRISSCCSTSRALTLPPRRRQGAVGVLRLFQVQ